MRCFSESFPKLSFLFFFCLCVSSDSSVWKVSVLSSSSVSSILESFSFCRSGLLCYSFQFLGLLSFLWSRRLQCSLCFPQFLLYLFHSFQLLRVFRRLFFHAFFVLWAFQLYLVSSDTLSAWERAHITSRLPNTLSTLSFSPLLFEHLEGQCPVLLHQQHLFDRFTVSKIYLYIMGYVFGSV